MARIRRDVWICDAPLCSEESEGEVGVPNRGYTGKVSTNPGSGVVNVPWFACEAVHIQGAVIAVCSSAHIRAWNS